MKIVHVMGSYIPNMGYQENYLPAEQKNLGHDVEIITSDRYSPHLSLKETVAHIYENRIVRSGIFYDNDIKIHRLPVQFEIKSHNQLLLKGLKKKLKELKPDIVQAHEVSSLYTVQSIMYQKSLGYQLFLDSHISYKNLKPYRYYKKLYFRFLKYSFFPFYLKRIQKIFPITPEAKLILLKEFGIPKNKIEFIPLGVNCKRFVFDENERLKLRQKLHVEKDDIVGIYAGKLTPIKQIPFLINASEEKLKKYDNIKLIILGNGPINHENEIKELVFNKGLTDKIIFHDFVKNDQLPNFYSAADFGVWPWGSSNTMLEAMSCSLPLILAQSEDTVHLLENNNGFFFKENNEKDFQNYLEILISNDELRKKMGKNSRQIIDKEFCSTVIAKKTLDIYENYTDHKGIKHD
jgi:glycosyltransferase involved in cell wall biosynthesis